MSKRSPKSLSLFIGNQRHIQLLCRPRRSGAQPVIASSSTITLPQWMERRLLIHQSLLNPRCSPELLSSVAFSSRILFTVAVSAVLNQLCPLFTPDRASWESVSEQLSLPNNMFIVLQFQSSTAIYPVKQSAGPEILDTRQGTTPTN